MDKPKKTVFTRRVPIFVGGEQSRLNIEPDTYVEIPGTKDEYARVGTMDDLHEYLLLYRVTDESTISIDIDKYEYLYVVVPVREEIIIDHFKGSSPVNDLQTKSVENDPRSISTGIDGQPVFPKYDRITFKEDYMPKLLAENCTGYNKRVRLIVDNYLEGVECRVIDYAIITR